MLDVIICEDNEYQRSQIEKIIRDEVKKLELDIALSTSNPHDVIKYVEEADSRCFMYFFDVDLGTNMNGIELASIIRKLDPRGYIIFVTSHQEFTQLSFEYKVQALDYIVKIDSVNMETKIRECIVEAYNQNKSINVQENKVIYINSGSNLIKFNIDDILFFETTNKDHKIRIHTCNEQVEFYGTIKDMEKMVSSDYYKSHRSFLVNTKNIKQIDKEKLVIYMVNGETCYVSKLYLKGLIKKCMI